MAKSLDSVQRSASLLNNHTPVSSLLDEIRKRLGCMKRVKNDMPFAVHAASVNSVVSCKPALLAAAVDVRFPKDPEAMRVCWLLPDFSRLKTYTEMKYMPVLRAPSAAALHQLEGDVKNA